MMIQQTNSVEDVSLEASNDDGNQLPSVEEAHTQKALDTGNAVSSGVGSSGDRRRNLIITSVCFVTVVILVIIVVAASGDGKGGSKSSSNSLARSNGGQYLIKELYEDDSSLFLDEESPQYKALAWLRGTSDVDIDEPVAGQFTAPLAEPFVQRYLVAVFIYAVTPNSARETFNLLDASSSECEWNALHEDQSIADATLRSSMAKELGVLCNEDQEVTELRFPTMGLDGTLPTVELEALTNLKKLELDSNRLDGSDTIPVIEGLHYLTLSRNTLSGTLPSNIGDMINLKVFSVSATDMEGSIPESIKNCASLEVLALDENDFNDGMFNLEPLTSMRELYLGANDFRSTLEETSFEGMTGMEVISLHNNLFRGPLPKVWFTKLLRLERLDVRHNEIGDNNEWSNAHMVDYDGNLEYLDISHNRLTGEIPRSIRHLVETLTHLDVSYNKFVSLPDSLEELTNLEVLNVNQFHDTAPQPFPTLIGSLTELTYLGMKSNFWSGTIPTFMGDLTNLELLDLADNQLNKEIPTELGELTKLQFLELNRNNLSGVVPPQITALPNLKLLWLDTNDLTGDLGPAADQCVIDSMSADCTKNGVLGDVECPCCQRCCMLGSGVVCEEEDWDRSYERASEEWLDVRLVRQQNDWSAGNYYFYRSQNRWEPVD